MINCAKCGNSTKLRMHFGLTYEYVNNERFKTMNPSSIWKYLSNLIPDSNKIISLNEGGTPLRLSNIGARINLKNLRIKDETRNPTGTFLDRGMTLPVKDLVLLIRAFTHEISHVVDNFDGYVLKYVGDAVISFFLVVPITTMI
jgi:threonine synthase